VEYVIKYVAGKWSMLLSMWLGSGVCYYVRGWEVEYVIKYVAGKWIMLLSMWLGSGVCY
jgi:hypothetical protein